MISGVDTGFAEVELYRSPAGVAYVTGLEVVQVGAGVLCLGLAYPWGERLGAWVPWIGGKRIHQLIPLLMGGAGAIAVATVVLTLMARFVPSWLGRTDAWTPTKGMSAAEATVLALAYAPMLLWAPALAVALIGYARRRAR